MLKYVLGGVGGYVIGRWLAQRQFATELAQPPTPGDEVALKNYNQRVAQRDQTAAQWAKYGAVLGVGSMFILR